MADKPDLTQQRELGEAISQAMTYSMAELSDAVEEMTVDQHIAFVQAISANSIANSLQVIIKILATPPQMVSPNQGIVMPRNPQGR